MRHSFTVMIQFPNFLWLPPDLNYYQVLEFLMGYCLKIYFLISKICIQITPMVSQNTLDWSFYLFFDWDFISRIVLRPSLNRSSDEWIESTIPVAQSICTHYSCYENMGRFVTLSKIWVAKSRVQKNRVIVTQKEKLGDLYIFSICSKSTKKSYSSKYPLMPLFWFNRKCLRAGYVPYSKMVLCNTYIKGTPKLTQVT